MDSNVLNLLVKLIVGATAGAAAGIYVPVWVKKIISYKCGKRGVPAPKEIMTDRKVVIAAAAVDTILAALTAVTMKPAAAAAAFLILQIALTCVFVDWYIRIIANEAIVLLLVLGVIYRILAGGASSLMGSIGALALVTALFGGCAAALTAMKGNPGVGAGDLKYAMVLAITVGWPSVLYMLLCFAATVLINIFIGMKISGFTMKTYFPMCLHLSVGLLGAFFLPVLGIV